MTTSPRRHLLPLIDPLYGGSTQKASKATEQCSALSTLLLHEGAKKWIVSVGASVKRTPSYLGVSRYITSQGGGAALKTQKLLAAAASCRGKGAGGAGDRPQRETREVPAFGHYRSGIPSYRGRAFRGIRAVFSGAGFGPYPGLYRASGSGARPAGESTVGKGREWWRQNGIPRAENGAARHRDSCEGGPCVLTEHRISREPQRFSADRPWR